MLGRSKQALIYYIQDTHNVWREKESDMITMVSGQWEINQRDIAFQNIDICVVSF